MEISLLIYDSRGFGISEGDLISFGDKEKYDLLFILYHLLTMYNINKFILYGKELGNNDIV